MPQALRRLRSARWRYRVRRQTLATVIERDGHGSDAHLFAAQQVAEIARRLPWWLRLDIDLTT